MATAAENLQTAYDNYALQLAELSVNPKPSYSVDGVSYSWTEYQSMLMEKLAALRTLIQRSQGPYMVVSKART